MSYFLRLISLEANQTGADGFLNDDDETYIQIDGETVWENDLETGDVVFFDDTDGFIDGIENYFFFENFVTISLYDEDKGLFGIAEAGGNDDFLGSQIIQPTTIDPFMEVVSLSESGSEYTLTYEVTPRLPI